MKFLFPGLFLTCLWTCLFSSSGCNYRSEADITVCDTSNVTYSGTVLPILRNNCYVCHSASVATAGIILDNYVGVKLHVDDGYLHKAINHSAGVTAMPYQRGKLDPCDISKIDHWIALGAPNN